jgi:hypothetical protein
MDRTYALRERVWLHECREVKLLNHIAEAIEKFEDTIIGAVSQVMVSPPMYVAVELNRKEIVPTINDVTKEIVVPEFTKNVWLKPRTWIVKYHQLGGLDIRKRT